MVPETNSPVLLHGGDPHGEVRSTWEAGYVLHTVALRDL